MTRIAGSTMPVDFGTAHVDGVTGSTTYDATTEIHGARSITYTGGNFQNIEPGGMGVNNRPYFGRIFCRIDGLPSARQNLYALMAASTNSYGIVAIDSGGQIRILPNDAGFNGSELATTITASVGQTICIEIKTQINTAGDDTLTFRIDGTEYGPFTGAYGTEVITGATIGPWLGNGGTFTFDSHAFNDDQGTSENTWCGHNRKTAILFMASDPGTSDADWQKPGGSTSNRHTSVDTFNPETYDSTSGSAEDYLRNAASGADQDLILTGSAYNTISNLGTVKVVEPVVLTGSSSATNTSGSIAMSNPTLNAVAFTSFDNGVASSTATTWPKQVATPVTGSDAEGVTESSGPTVTVRKVQSTTRVAIVNTIYVIVEYEEAVPAGQTFEHKLRRHGGLNLRPRRLR
jgi:hypothetical protein